MSIIPQLFGRSINYFKFLTGQYISELGMGMERLGSVLTQDRAYMQALPRHRNIMIIDEQKPIIENSFVATNSTLCGDVYVGSYASIWYNAVLRAEVNPIRIGSYSSIGDGTVIYTLCPVPTGVPGSVNIGKNVTIQSNCIIYSSIIDDDVFIGNGSIIGEGVKIEKGAVIAPNSFIPSGRLIPGRQLWSGNPIKYVRELTDEEVYSNFVQSFNIWNSAQTHLNQFEQKEKDEDINPDSLVASYLSENYFKWRGKHSNF